MKLYCIKFSVRILHSRHRTCWSSGRYRKSFWSFLNIICMAHPAHAARGDVLGKRALLDELHIALAVFALGSVLHPAAQRVGDELAAVADAEDGDTEL